MKIRATNPTANNSTAMVIALPSDISFFGDDLFFFFAMLCSWFFSQRNLVYKINLCEPGVIINFMLINLSFVDLQHLTLYR